MEIPEGALLCTVSIDVQARYLAVLTCGWALTGEMWTIDYEKIECEPRDVTVWRGLAEYLNAVRYEHPKGDVCVHIVGVDSGYLADTVYQACRLGNSQPKRAGKWWFATKGVGGLVGEPVVLPMHDERDSHGHRGPRPLRINTDEAKAELMASLAVKEPGPWYVHFPKRLASTDLAKELTSEEQRTKFDADGVVVGTEWKKRSADARNEGLDCACICLALYHHVSKSQWLYLLQKRFGPEEGLRLFRERHPDVRIICRKASA